VQRAAAASRKRAVLRNQKNPPVNFVTNIVQIILDKLAVLNEQKRERGGSRFHNHESLRRFIALALKRPINITRYEIFYRFHRVPIIEKRMFL